MWMKLSYTDLFAHIRNGYKSGNNLKICYQWLKIKSKSAGLGPLKGVLRNFVHLIICKIKTSSCDEIVKNPDIKWFLNISIHSESY